ncbi:hypothetical protein SO802_022511 [Lithocarpus litseifolius]|uniref:Ycf1 n=1 Tax=Lithocarpus litseifolius TaxID=425828 RepID=A0AAW2C5I9_9ROSI
MHDLLQDMGQEIVRRESPREPGGRSRLWIYKDVIRVLKNNANLDELRLIDLSDSQNLIEMPDLSGAPKLKQLILQRCIKLSKIHASLGNLKCLIRLDLNSCECLESLPPKISLESLEIFILSGCSRLKKFPEVVGNMSKFGKIESYHLDLIYYPYNLFNQKFKENWSQVDANGLDQIEIEFKTKGPGLEVTKCGARWVFEQDIEDLNQTMYGCNNCSSYSITPYEDDLEDSAKDTKTE